MYYLHVPLIPPKLVKLTGANETEIQDMTKHYSCKILGFLLIMCKCYGKNFMSFRGFYKILGQFYKI